LSFTLFNVIFILFPSPTLPEGKGAKTGGSPFF